MSERNEIKERLEQTILGKIEQVNECDKEDSSRLMCEVDTLCKTLNEFDKTDNTVESESQDRDIKKIISKKERRIKFAGELFTALIAVGGYLTLHCMAMRYEDKENVFHLSSTKTNLNKAGNKK